MMKQAHATIAASGTTTTEAIRMDNFAFGGLILPATFTGSAISFLVCDTATGTFVPVYDGSGAAVTVTVAQGHAVAITGTAAEALAPWAFVKLVSNATEGADRSIVVCLK